jgi:ketopantoate reductase
MRVAIVGAGALGSVYGARLACLGGCEVEVVTGSAPRAVAGGVIRLERVDGGRDDALEWSPPAAAVRAPDGVDVVLVCVRYEQLDTVRASACDGGAPVVVLTPMMPRDQAMLSADLPGRVTPAMPGVVAYRNGVGTFRYWLPRSAATWIEARSPAGAEVELGRRLERAGIRTRIEPGVLARNVATTVSFLPFALALDVAGGVDAVLADAPLLALTLRAVDEGRALGRSLGKPEAWASMILAFARPFLLKTGVAMARSRAPEALRYAEEHFGRKLHAQNVAMGARVVELAKERAMRCQAFEELLDRL